MVRHLLGHPRASDLNLTRDALIARFRDHDPRWRHLLRIALQSYASERGARTVVEKTPAHLLHVPRILQWYPDARIVVVLRDGRDAVLSMLAAEFTHGDLRRHACNWRRMAELGEELAVRYPRHLHTVRFEDLVTRPRAVLTELHAFLDMPMHPDQLDSGPSSDAIPAWETAWKSSATAPIDPSRIDTWRHLATPQQRWALHAIMGDTLARLGYLDATLDDCPLPSRVRHRAMAHLWRAALHPSVRPVTASVWRRVRSRLP